MSVSFILNKKFRNAAAAVVICIGGATIPNSELEGVLEVPLSELAPQSSLRNPLQSSSGPSITFQSPLGKESNSSLPSSSGQEEAGTLAINALKSQINLSLALNDFFKALNESDKATFALAGNLLDAVENDAKQDHFLFPQSENIIRLQSVLASINQTVCKTEDRKSCALEIDGIFGMSTGKSLLSLATYIVEKFPDERPLLTPESHPALISLLKDLGLEKELNAYLEKMNDPAYQTVQEQRRTIEMLEQKVADNSKINELINIDLSKELRKTAKEGLGLCIPAVLGDDPGKFIDELAKEQKTLPDPFTLEDLSRAKLETECALFLNGMDKEDGDRRIKIIVNGLREDIYLWILKQILVPPPKPKEILLLYD